MKDKACAFHITCLTAPMFTPDTFAIIESAEYMDNNESDSLFRDIKLEAAQKAMDGAVLRRKFYVVDVEAFKDPLCWNT